MKFDGGTDFLLFRFRNCILDAAREDVVYCRLVRYDPPCMVVMGRNSKCSREGK